MLFENSFDKHGLRSLRIVVAHNDDVVTKRNIIAIKMAHRSISFMRIRTLMKLAQTGESSQMSVLRRLSFTTIQIIRDDETGENVQWVQGDIPIIEHTRVLIGMPIRNRTFQCMQKSVDQDLRQSNSVGCCMC